MITNEQRAHDLALLGVRAALEGKTQPLDENKNIVEDYVLRYRTALEAMNKEFPHQPQE